MPENIENTGNPPSELQSEPQNDLEQVLADITDIADILQGDIESLQNIADQEGLTIDYLEDLKAVLQVIQEKKIAIEEDAQALKEVSNSEAEQETMA